MLFVRVTVYPSVNRVLCVAISLYLLVTHIRGVSAWVELEILSRSKVKDQGKNAHLGPCRHRRTLHGLSVN